MVDILQDIWQKRQILIKDLYKENFAFRVRNIIYSHTVL